MQRSVVFGVGLAVVMSVAIGAIGTSGAEQQAAGASCDQYLSPQRKVNGKPVGPASCMSQETKVSLDGRPYTRLDLGIDGSVEGCAVGFEVSLVGDCSPSFRGVDGGVGEPANSERRSDEYASRCPGPHVCRKVASLRVHLTQM